jgi:5-oxoprolinase (ATP-hydrolysing) subunit A
VDAGSREENASNQEPEDEKGTMMSIKINLNADMAEGFGAYNIGDDAGILKIIGSANIACGFHAGDPLTMRKIVSEAKREGVSVGAHPGFNDIWGFGRRRIDMRADDLEYMIAYQIGALQALAAYSDVKVTHLKPHGALNNMAAENSDYAMAIGRAIKSVDRHIIYVALAGSEMEKAARALGLKVAREGFCDRQYEEDGNLTSRKIPGSVIKDPVAATKQVVEMVLNNTITSRSGKTISCTVDTLCLHGDEPTAITIAKSVRDGLEKAGVKLVPLTEMALD